MITAQQARDLVNPINVQLCAQPCLDVLEKDIRTAANKGYCEVRVYYNYFDVGRPVVNYIRRLLEELGYTLYVNNEDTSISFTITW